MIITILLSFLLIARLTYLKIYTKDDYYKRALELWTRSAPVEGRRGNIYDRNGKLIVGSELAPTVVVIPKQIKDIDYTAGKIAEILECDTSEVKKHLTKKVQEINDGKYIPLIEEIMNKPIEELKELYNNREIEK